MISLPAAIEMRALTKRYRRTTALNGIDLKIPTGSVFGMIGPNGAGKTTTIRLLLDIIRPSSGTVAVLGKDPRSGGPSLREQIGYLPGELKLQGRVSGRELIRHYADISGPISKGAIATLAERLDLDLDRQVRTLSKGNKQKLGLVQAFMHKPALLVLDEPTSGQDPLVQQEFLSMVREARDSGATVFLSSHILREVGQAADTVAILRQGKILAVSSVDELRESAVRKVRARFTRISAEVLRMTLSKISNLTEFDATERNGLTELTATISGDIYAFISTIAAFSIAELAIEEPDLEESVLNLYRGGAADAK
ncbi:ABC transporter ATP-binding protein [Arthrobacter antibioticus]|uniref:ABC transporter ATP-binding protein n=1 Tax=Arthrobacter sp. H35-MC1 TaxID=3046203 RepID=UPI0024B97C39|nr:ABC transporter ATP-binding protein [Arthrobacter sp. H35-MC1]MDJ0316302.1 ABC transporter ATP-binding protein [Arthrobacter sp. H35-MC1]